MQDLHEVSINGGTRRTEARHGSRLLDVLDSQGMHLPSACGSSGRCGLCRVTVTRGVRVVTDAESVRLTADEQSQGVHLACQVAVDGPMDIQIPSELLGSREFAGIVVRKRLVAREILELVVRLQPPAAISFHPGQYVMLRCHPDPAGPPVMRAFSISSSLRNEDRLELLVRLNQQGVCTPWIFNELQEGGSIAFTGPRGNAYLRNTMRPVLLIAGGSGMAPVRSILLTLRDERIERPAIFFFGGLTRQDLFYLDEMHNLERELPDFRFIPALSEEPIGSSWTGERGLITEVIERKLRDGSSSYEAYLCGKPAMIDSCVPILQRKGISRDSMVFDYFRVARPAL